MPLPTSSPRSPRWDRPPSSPTSLGARPETASHSTGPTLADHNLDGSITTTRDAASTSSDPHATVGWEIIARPYGPGPSRAPRVDDTSMPTASLHDGHRLGAWQRRISWLPSASTSGRPRRLCLALQRQFTINRLPLTWRSVQIVAVRRDGWYARPGQWRSLDCGLLPRFLTDRKRFRGITSPSISPASRPWLDWLSKQAAARNTLVRDCRHLRKAGRVPRWPRPGLPPRPASSIPVRSRPVRRPAVPGRT